MLKQLLSTAVIGAGVASMPALAQTSDANDFIYSPYKDTSINLNWNTDVISTTVADGHTSQPLLDALLPQNKVVSLAFASGSCASEKWGGVAGSDLAAANLKAFQDKGIGYIISTGGAAGTFTCGSLQAESGDHPTDSREQNKQDMQAFLKRYAGPSFKGLDFDIEGGYSKDNLEPLMQAAADVQQEQPLRVSLTLATLAEKQADGHVDTLNDLGQQAIEAANKAGLKYNVNLMVMDYGKYGCNVDQNGNIDPSGQCSMAGAAEVAAKAVSKDYNIPLNHIEVTPMIGDNDYRPDVTTAADATQIARFAKQNHLAGLHYWSFDRDRQCSPIVRYASPTCNNEPNLPRGFDQAFLDGLAQG